jgi:DNA-binding NtrC family response regulator
VENTFFRAIVLCDGEVLQVSDFPQIATLVDGYSHSAQPAAIMEMHRPANGTQMSAPQPQRNSFADFARSNFSDGIAVTDAAGNVRKLEDIEAEMIRLAIEKYKGHMTEVARRLGIGRSTLYRKIRDLGLEVREEH